jgi:GxxExxY protein
MSHEFEAISGKVIEAAIAVHKELGPGYVEPIYHRAMKVAMNHRQLPYESQREVHIIFEGEEVGKHRMDLIAGRELIVELKAVSELLDVHFAQVKSYLKATRLHAGLLMNFNATTLAVKRIVL